MDTLKDCFRLWLFELDDQGSAPVTLTKKPLLIQFIMHDTDNGKLWSRAQNTQYT